MNKSNLKSYAPQARKDFIAAVTARANLLGLSDRGGMLEVAPAQTQGDITVIAGQAWPAKVSSQRDRLIERIRKDGFAQTMEAIAYTWFNRFAALRYMELHDYLGHGHRALSSTSGGLPDILTHATVLTNELPGLNAAKVTELKLAGNRDGELYRMLLVAQCNALSRAMPFLFERIDDDSELLLPDNLLRSDSVIAKLVAEIPEEDWAEVEIIGWLYQFYISEKKDQVIGKVVKSEDIPAATQLFTPNWIVQYLVQNSVGRLWLMANPQSTLAGEWPYYITPAEQTPEVQAQLDALIQTRVREDGDTLNPETITVLDPACGSGHILVVAYDVLKAIYLERGYQPRAVPRLILEKNLYGLDIDDRAAQMAGFALLMKARADDRRLFTTTDDAGNLQPPKLNVLSLQESKGLNLDELATHLAPFKVQRATIAALLSTFEHAKTFGSLIQIPDALKTHLAVLPEVVAEAGQSGDIYATAAADDLLPLVQQAQVLAMQFDAVVANPPYMGGKGMNPVLKEFARQNFEDSRYDLFAVFIVRSLLLLKRSGLASLVTMHAWLFLSSFEVFRRRMLRETTIRTLAHLGSRAFSEISGEIVQTVAFTVGNANSVNHRPSFQRLVDGDEMAKQVLLTSGRQRFTSLIQDDLQRIPGAAMGYWLSREALSNFQAYNSLADISEARSGMSSCNSALFLRAWYEVSVDKLCVDAISHEDALKSGKRWFPYNKGGGGRRWYGYDETVINWFDGGSDIKAFVVTNPNDPDTTHFSRRLFNLEFFFKKGVTWSAVSSGGFAVRAIVRAGVIPGTGSKTLYDLDDHGGVEVSAAILNSVVARHYLSVLSPTLNYEAGDVGKLPMAALNPSQKETIGSSARQAIKITEEDWNEFETSQRFIGLQLVKQPSKSLLDAWEGWGAICQLRRKELNVIETEIDRQLISVYKLESELYAGMGQQIHLAEERRDVDCQRLISYAIGCMMGRYSLDEPGLIYAHAGNIGFEPSRYTIFPADADGIIPITDELWFSDDAPSRIREFLRAVWGPGTLEENMAWLAESLGTKASETPEETIRRYIADKFFKDHLQTYKKRPIYWLFSSGKQGAFQALVYLHRYHEGTLARLRAEYVVPLTSKIQSRIEMLQKDAAAASSTAARTKLAKEVEKLNKKHAELLAYDEKLRHYADMRITLDLDDGVKVNYGKFGDLLEGVKIVTGGSADD